MCLLTEGSRTEDTRDELRNVNILGILAVEKLSLRTYRIDRYVLIGMLGISIAGMRGQLVAILAGGIGGNTAGLMVSSNDERSAGMAQNELNRIGNGLVITGYVMTTLLHSDIMRVLINMSFLNHDKELAVALRNGLERNTGLVDQLIAHRTLTVINRIVGDDLINLLLQDGAITTREGVAPVMTSVVKTAVLAPTECANSRTF